MVVIIKEHTQKISFDLNIKVKVKPNLLELLISHSSLCVCGQNTPWHNAHVR